MTAEPCMCGATDCPRCYPFSYWEEGTDEDEANRSDAKYERACDEADYRRQQAKDNQLEKRWEQSSFSFSGSKYKDEP